MDEATDINGIKRTWANLWNAEFKQGVMDLSKHNSDLAISLLRDFSQGINCTTKGVRGEASLLRLRAVIRSLSKRCGNKDIDKLSQEEITKIIIKENSEHFAKNVKVVFNWLERTGRIKGNPTKHISAKDFSKGKPPWVYLGEEKIKLLINALNTTPRALTSFFYDTGIRTGEGWRIRVYDFQEDYTILEIPEKRDNGERVAKKGSFGRKIKLKLCPSLIKEYVKINHLKPSDLLIQITQAGYNKALRVACKKLFGKEEIKDGEKVIICEKTKARESPDRITANDLRHNSACFWLKRYKTNKDLMYRFGWKNEDKVFYYTEFLDMRDTIDDEDLITPEEKTLMEKEIIFLKKQVKEQNEKMDNLIKNLTTSSDDIFENEDLVRQAGLMDQEKKAIVQDHRKTKEKKIFMPLI